MSPKTTVVYPSPVASSPSVLSDVTVDGKIRRSRGIEIAGVGLGKRVHREETDVVSGTLRGQTDRCATEIVTHPHCSLCNMWWGLPTLRKGYSKTGWIPGEGYYLIQESFRWG